MRTKRVEVTNTGLRRLYETPPEVIAVQDRRFGKSRHAGGKFLKEVLRVDHELRQ